MTEAANSSSGYVFTPEVVFLILVCLALCVFIGWHSKKNMDKGIIDNASQIVVSIGVMFTFIGITVGLVSFDQTSIRSSLPAFLGGMKVAFFTSIIGMVTGLIIKYMQRNAVRKNNQQVFDAMAEIKKIRAEMDVIKSLNEANNVVAKAQLAAIIDNGKQLTEMKVAFANCLKEINVQVGTELSKAFDRSIKGLSVNLERQFKDSFKPIQVSTDKLIGANGHVQDTMNKMMEYDKKLQETAYYLTQCSKYIQDSVSASIDGNVKVFKEWEQEYVKTMQSKCMELMYATQSIDKLAKDVVPALASNSQAFTETAQNFAGTMGNCKTYVDACTKSANEFVKATNTLSDSDALETFAVAAEQMASTLEKLEDVLTKAKQTETDLGEQLEQMQEWKKVTQTVKYMEQSLEESKRLMAKMTTEFSSWQAQKNKQ